MENNHRRVGIIVAFVIVVLALIVGGITWKNKQESTQLAATYKELLAQEGARAQIKEEAAAWQVFTPETETFSVTFPGKPEFKTQTMALPNNTGQAVFNSYEVIDVDAAMYGVYEISGISFTGNQADLENALANYIKSNSKYTLVSSAPSTFLGHTALDFLIQVQGNYYLKGKYVATDDRLYQINVLYDKSTYSEATFDTFVNSFKVE